MGRGVLDEMRLFCFGVCFSVLFLRGGWWRDGVAYLLGKYVGILCRQGEDEFVEWISGCRVVVMVCLLSTKLQVDRLIGPSCCLFLALSTVCMFVAVFG